MSVQVQAGAVSTSRRRFEYQPSTDIKWLKQQIFEKYNVQVENQSLIYRQEMITDDSLLLSSFNFTERDIIVMINRAESYAARIVFNSVKQQIFPSYSTKFQRILTIFINNLKNKRIADANSLSLDTHCLFYNNEPVDNESDGHAMGFDGSEVIQFNFDVIPAHTPSPLPLPQVSTTRNIKVRNILSNAVVDIEVNINGTTVDIEEKLKESLYIYTALKTVMEYKGRYIMEPTPLAELNLQNQDEIRVILTTFEFANILKVVDFGKLGRQEVISEYYIDYKTDYPSLYNLFTFFELNGMNCSSLKQINLQAGVDTGRIIFMSTQRGKSMLSSVTAIWNDDIDFPYIQSVLQKYRACLSISFDRELSYDQICSLYDNFSPLTYPNTACVVKYNNIEVLRNNKPDPPISAEEEEKKKAEEEAKKKAEEEAKKKAEEEARLKAEEEAKKKAEEEARLKAEEERLKAEEEKLKAMEEEIRRKEEEEKKRREEERLKAIEEERKRREAEEEARRKEAEELMRKREEEKKKREEEKIRRAEEARLAEEARIAEEAKKAEEEARMAEEARLAEEAKKAEEARLAEEEARIAEEEAKKAEEEAKKAEEEKKIKEARMAEEARAVEVARLAEIARVAEEARLRKEEEDRIAEEERLAEEEKLRKEEEDRKAAEAKAIEDARIAEVARRIEEAKKAEEEARDKARQEQELQESIRRKKIEEERLNQMAIASLMQEDLVNAHDIPIATTVPTTSVPTETINNTSDTKQSTEEPLPPINEPFVPQIQEEVITPRASRNLSNMDKRASRHLDASVIARMSFPDPNIRELEWDKPGIEGINELCLHTNLYQCVECLTFLVPVGDDGLEIICDFIKQGAFPLLKELSLESNSISDMGMTCIADVIRCGKLAQLQSLILMNNNIGDNGLLALSEVLVDHSIPLEMINLSQNKFTDAGLRVFAQNINKSNVPLKKLFIKANPNLSSISDTLALVNNKYTILYDQVLNTMAQSQINTSLLVASQSSSEPINIPTVEQAAQNPENTGDFNTVRTSLVPGVPYEFESIPDYINHKIAEESVSTVVIKSSDELNDFINKMNENPEKYIDIETITANNAALGNSGIIELAKLFDDENNFKKLKKLELQSNNIGSTGFVSLINGIANHKSSVSALNRWLGKSKGTTYTCQLEVLDIGKNRVKTQGTIFLFNLISQGKFPNLLSLDISANGLDDGAMDAFMKLLKDSKDNKINIPAEFTLGNNSISVSKSKQVQEFIRTQIEN